MNIYLKSIGFFLLACLSINAFAAIEISGPSTSPINQSYTISWNSAGSGFKYTLQECRGRNCNLTPNLKTTSISIKHSYPGTRTYKVKACYSTNCGGYGNSHSINVYGKPSSSVTPNVASRQGINFTYKVSWSPVRNATYYKLKECKGSNCNYTESSNRSINVSHSYSGTRSYSVQACNEVGCASSGGTVSVYIYGKPTTVITPKPQLESPINTSYKIEWDSVPGATSYTLKECKGSECNTTKNIAAEVYWHQGQSSEGYRYYQIKACNKVGCASYGGSKSVYVYGKPQAPIQPEVPNKAAANQAYEISWSPVTYAENYLLRECFGDNNCNLTPISSEHQKDIVYKHKGHQTAGVRSYQVQACNVVGCSDFGERSYVQIGVPPTAPSFNINMTSEVTLYHPFHVSWLSSDNATYYNLEKCNDGLVNCENYLVNAVETERGYEHEITLNDEGINEASLYIKACNEFGCSSNNKKDIAVTTTRNIKAALMYVGYPNDGSDVSTEAINWSDTPENLALINALGESGVNRLVVLPTVHIPAGEQPYYSYETKAEYHKDNKLISSVHCNATKNDEEAHASTIKNFTAFGNDLNNILNLVKKSNHDMKVWISTPPVEIENRYIPNNEAVVGDKGWVNWLITNYLSNSSYRNLIDGIYMYDENFWICNAHGNRMLKYMTLLRDELDSNHLFQKLHYVWAPHRGAIYKDGELATTVRDYSKLQSILSNGKDSDISENADPEFLRVYKLLEGYGETPIFDYIFLQPNVMVADGWENEKEDAEVQWVRLLTKIRGWILNSSNYETVASRTLLGLDMEVDRNVCLASNKRKKYEEYQDTYLPLKDSVPQMFYFDMKHSVSNKNEVLSYKQLVELVADYFNGKPTSVGCFGSAP